MASNAYADMTINELKNKLRAKGAKLAGRKHELIERLQSYDRNANFGQVIQPDNFVMTLPDVSCYKDINSDTKIPVLTESNVKTYLHLFGQDIRSKAREMYNDKFLKSVRIATTDKETVFQGRVLAEMVKSCVYKVDVKLDEHCVVTECQCECAAGMGPEAHCKHVVVVLYAITRADSGIVVMETCTQVLQTFHQSKRFMGSPVKMEDLELRRTGVVLASLKEFDPRPAKYKMMPGYQSHFRSGWLNSTAKCLAIRQLYAPANVYGIVHDHRYMEKCESDFFLDKLHVTAIDDGERSAIEIKTRGQSQNKLWRDERLLRLQSSNFGRICKLTDKTDMTKFAKSLTIAKHFSTEATKHGQKYESVALTEYEKRSCENVQESGIWVCGDMPYLGCSPDGIVNSDGIIEIKCPYTARDKPVTPQNVPYLQHNDDDSLSLRRDHDYYYQVMGTLLCTQRKWCDFVVWTFCDCVIIRIPRDDEFIDNMKHKLSNFFAAHFKNALLETFLYKDTHIFTGSY